MKISPEKIIINFNENIIKKRVFLICGNEETLINKVKLELIKKYKDIGFDYVKNDPNKNLTEAENDSFDRQLFTKFQIIIFENPSKVDISFFNKIDLDNSLIIIIHNKLTNTSKIKKSFEEHKDFIVVNCYKLTRDLKKIYFDSFLSLNQITLSADIYWFIVDNTSDYYQLFENEIKKLILHNKNNISIKEVRLLMSSFVQNDMDKMFFLILGSFSNLITQTEKNILSSSDSYLLLQRIKFFVNLLYTSKNTREAENKFPKYLFKEKLNYLKIFEKSNKKKFLHSISLISKAELMLRKYQKNHLFIIQRFLINLKKTLV